MDTTSRSTRRKIHVDLPADLHQKLRIKAALEGLSIQALVSRLIGAAVRNIKVPTKTKTSKAR
jgi:plasmid stability protein